MEWSGVKWSGEWEGQIPHDPFKTAITMHKNPTARITWPHVADIGIGYVKRCTNYELSKEDLYAHRVGILPEGAEILFTYKDKYNPATKEELADIQMTIVDHAVKQIENWNKTKEARAAPGIYIIQEKKQENAKKKQKRKTKTQKTTRT